MTRLVDLAKVLRSKNSGPFELTMDILMPDEASYRRVMESGVLTKESIAKLYRIPIENIRTLAHMDAACGVKITILRIPCSRRSSCFATRRREATLKTNRYSTLIENKVNKAISNPCRITIS